MDLAVLILCGLNAVLLLVLIVLVIVLRGRTDGNDAAHTDEKLDQMRREMMQAMSDSRVESNRLIQDSVKNLGEVLTASQKSTNDLLAKGQATLQTTVTDMARSTEAKLDKMRETVQTRLTEMQTANGEQLEKMRATVDEKLQKTLEDRLGQSFKLVSERLEQVYKGLGEMQTLAEGVGDIKKVLSNVKTRGILGEVQLGALLEQVLAPEQYEANIATVKGSQNRVEFAVRMPGQGDQPVYLPIDAKFPADAYSQLTDAYETGDPAVIEAAAKVLETRIKSFAKDIRDKYLDPPATTDFGIMFLPFEGLYAEVVRRGLVDVLQRDYKVNIAGPTTMAALLNSLQMGFRTLALQKRSSEVWTVLGAVKTEFDKFNGIIEGIQKKLVMANEDLDKLVGTRTRKIQRTLRDVTALPEADAVRLIDSAIEEE